MVKRSSLLIIELLVCGTLFFLGFFSCSNLCHVKVKATNFSQIGTNSIKETSLYILFLKDNKYNN